MDSTAVASCRFFSLALSPVFNSCADPGKVGGCLSLCSLESITFVSAVVKLTAGG